ncbi:MULTISPECIES: ABC transporter substrate-binding protein [unclassified Mycobacterium]|uniref:ABC transporter substrate-binding protein n=1 Tax=unclassified Mycobacterium TaxID=2642494 RepID=UPI0007FD74A2|nr:MULTISPECIES: ABC transporter substrate-binding protein [unclassified Mycobacterium]OBH00477.1 ABC transporter substrate-binding protein [Mycobacterium sp. E3247]OBI14717.1 ABC transporter substrate-binding protein [Mycobacterium sp. E2497]
MWRGFVALTAAVGLVLTGCVSRAGNSGPAAAPAAVPLSELSGLTLQVGDQKGGTEALLRSAGQLDKLPYRIAFSTFTSGPPQVEAATAGKIDFAITGNTPPIFGAASNAKIKAVSAYGGGGAGNRILVHADSPITSVTDLRGKTIAVAKGSSSHANLLAQLEKAGLKPVEVKFVFLQPADALSAFSQRQADAWAIWDPYTAQAEQQIPVRSIAEAQGVTNGDWIGVASDQALADPKRNTALSDLLVRFERAVQWARSHPQEWAQNYAAAVGLDPRVAAVAEARSLRLPTELGDEVVASEQKLANLFAAAGQLQSSPRFSNWVDRRFNEVLRQGLVS